MFGYFSGARSLNFVLVLSMCAQLAEVVPKLSVMSFQNMTRLLVCFALIVCAINALYPTDHAHIPMSAALNKAIDGRLVTVARHTIILWSLSLGCA